MQKPKMLEIQEIQSQIQGPRNTYKYLFISNTIFLVEIVVTYLRLSFNIDPTIYSNVICKLWYYLN
jgi:hypothetical protein